MESHLAGVLFGERVKKIAGFYVLLSFKMKDTSLHNQRKLLSQIAAGDEKAFAQIMLHYSGLIHSFVYKHVKREELVEEIVNDIFLKIWLTRETLEEIKNFELLNSLFLSLYTLSQPSAPKKN